MTTLETLKWDGKKSGKVNLDLAVAKETSSADLIHRAVLRQLANKRQGTASTLTRSEVRGGGRKPYKQKGTGSCLLYTSPSPRDMRRSRMPSSA